MRMAQNHRIDLLGGVKGETGILRCSLFPLPLKKTAVEEDALSSNLQFVTGASHLTCSAMGNQLNGEQCSVYTVPNAYHSPHKSLLWVCSAFIVLHVLP